MIKDKDAILGGLIFHPLDGHTPCNEGHFSVKVDTAPSDSVWTLVQLLLYVP